MLQVSALEAGAPCPKLIIHLFLPDMGFKFAQSYIDITRKYQDAFCHTIKIYFATGLTGSSLDPQQTLVFPAGSSLLSNVVSTLLHHRNNRERGTMFNL